MRSHFAVRATLLALTFACADHKPCEKVVCVETPIVFNRLQLYGMCGERIWALQGDNKTAAGDITYGVVPPGYRQTFPAAGSPRPLRKGECVVLLHRASDKF